MAVQTFDEMNKSSHTENFRFGRCIAHWRYNGLSKRADLARIIQDEEHQPDLAAAGAHG